MAEKQWKLSLTKAMRDDVEFLVKRDPGTYLNPTDFVRQAIGKEMERARKNPPARKGRT